MPELDGPMNDQMCRRNGEVVAIGTSPKQRAGGAISRWVRPDTLMPRCPAC